MKKTHYFDYAAATPVSDSVLKAMQPYFAEKFYNPSALYLAAQDIRQAIAIARMQVASVLGSKPSEIIFTAGGTESDNLAIHGLMKQYNDGNVVVSAIEHNAVMEPAKKYQHKIAPVRPDGRVDIDKLVNLIDDQTVLVSIMYVNNELGTIQPLAEIARKIKDIRKLRQKAGNKLPIFFHTDACQAANYLYLLVNTLGVDMMTLNGGKIYGPKQSGILYVKTGINLQPQNLGGGQERNLRSGTENVAGITGFAAALSETTSVREIESKRLHGLQHEFIKTLADKLPQTIINGSLENRVPNNIHLTIPQADNERLMMELDERGIMVATGSACSASSDEPSHVLKAIGMSDEHARSSLRITFGRQTLQADIDALLTQLIPLV